MTNRTHVEGNQPQQAVPPAVKVTIGRRRLLTSGAAAAPVLALRSGNVLAGADPWKCRSVSAYLSGASYLSHHPQGSICYGRTPGYWKGNPQAWPPPYKVGDCLETAPNGTCTAYGTGNYATLMSAVWPIGGSSARYNGKTMMQTLWMTGAEDPFQAGSHLVAAVLNLASGKVPADILPMPVIVAMGNAVLSGSSYQAAPGVVWNGAQVVAYLKQTMPL